MQSAGVEIGWVNTAKTEVIGDGGERPDLAYMDGNGTERVLIEVKFWAGLTTNQPVTYLDSLPEDRPSALLVVAHSIRLETLWPELNARAGEFPMSNEGSATEARWVSAGDSRHLILISWTNLLSRMEGAANDEQTWSNIRQLQGLADQQDAEEFLPLRAEQLSPEIPRLILNLNRLVDDVSSRIFATDWASRDRMQKRWDEGLFQYMTVSGLSVWIGVNYYFWRDYETTPLWIGFNNSVREHEERILRNLKPIRWKEPSQFIEDDWIIPIRLKTGIDYEKVVDDVVGQLSYVAELLRST